MFESLKRRRDQILEEMRSMVRMRRGRLTTQYFTKNNRKGERVKQGPYYLLQGWLRGKHVSQRIPEEEVERVRGDIEAHERFKTMSAEFVDLTERLTCNMDMTASKKKPRNYRRGVIVKPRPSSP